MHQKKKVSVGRIVTGRIVSVLPVVVLQGLIIYGIAKWLAPFATLFYSVLSVLSALFVLFLISNRGAAAGSADVSVLREQADRKCAGTASERNA